MSGSNPAPRPPPRGSYSLAAGAGAGGAVPAPAPGAAAEEKEAEGPAEAPAGTAGPAATGAFVARVAASPGVNVDVEVRIKMEDGGFVEGVITGRRSVDSSYPVAPLGLSEAQSVLRAIVRHVVQPLWNFVSPMGQNGPMEFIDLVFQWLDLGVSESFVNGMVCKVHVEFQKAFQRLHGSSEQGQARGFPAGGCESGLPPPSGATGRREPEGFWLVFGGNGS